jgi:hypothetical protein
VLASVRGGPAGAARTPRSGGLLIVAALLALLTLSCGGDTTSPSDEVVFLVLEPSGLQFTFIGEEATLSVTALNGNRTRVDLPNDLVWLSSDATVARADGSGVIRAMSNGLTQITVSRVAGPTSNPVSASVAQVANSIDLDRDSLVFDSRCTERSIRVDVRDAGGTPISAGLVGWTTEPAGALVFEAQDDTTVSVAPRLEGEAELFAELHETRSNRIHTRAAFTPTRLAGEPGVGTSQAGVPLAHAAAVRVLDDQDCAVPGRAVSWRVLTGGGFVSRAESSSDSAGFATTEWTLGASPGVNILKAGSASTGGTSIEVAGVNGWRVSVLTVEGETPDPNDPPVVGRPYSMTLEVLVPLGSANPWSVPIVRIDEDSERSWPFSDTTRSIFAIGEILGGYLRADIAPGSRDTVTIEMWGVPNGTHEVRPVVNASPILHPGPMVKLTRDVDDTIPPTVMAGGDTIFTTNRPTVTAIARDASGIYHIGWEWAWDQPNGLSCGGGGGGSWLSANSVTSTRQVAVTCPLEEGKPHAVIVSAFDGAFNLGADTFNIWYVPSGRE